MNDKAIQPLPPVPVEASLRYSMRLACAYLQLSESYMYEKISRGEIRVVRDGRRVFIPGSEIIRLSRAS